MQCVILAAGRGTRMGVLTDDTPKPMLPIRGIPKLAYTLRTLPEEITEVIFVIGYRGEKIREYFGDTFERKSIRYAQQHKLDGSGGAVHLAKEMLTGKFLVLMGDDLYLKEDLERLMQHEFAVLACEMKETSEFGVLETDATGRLVRIIEKPHAPEYTLVNTGAYVLNNDFFAYPLVPISETEFGLPQTLVQMNDKQGITVLKTKTWFPIGNPEALAEAQKIIGKFV